MTVYSTYVSRNMLEYVYISFSPNFSSRERTKSYEIRRRLFQNCSHFRHLRSIIKKRIRNIKKSNIMHKKRGTDVTDFFGFLCACKVLSVCIPFRECRRLVGTQSVCRDFCRSTVIWCRSTEKSRNIQSRAKQLQTKERLKCTAESQ